MQNQIVDFSLWPVVTYLHAFLINCFRNWKYCHTIMNTMLLSIYGESAFKFILLFHERNHILTKSVLCWNQYLINSLLSQPPDFSFRNKQR